MADTSAETCPHIADSRDCVIAIDPGRSKCGLAVVNRNGDSPFRSIVLSANIASELDQLISTYRPSVIVVGNGTGSKQTLECIREALTSPVPVRSISEAYTSEEARRRYIKEVKPRGLQRLIPESLRSPHCPYDDYVAVILGERYWHTMSNGPEPPDDIKLG